MRLKYIYLIVVVLLLFGCKENFEVWKDYNEDFLTKIAETDTFKTTNDGLKYIDRFNGKGAIPKQKSMVKIAYSATLSDGTPCTSLDTINYVYNYPIGIQIALMQMNRESVWTLCIPYNLAYGVSGTKNTYGNYIIPPYSTIYVKELELKEVVNY